MREHSVRYYCDVEADADTNIDTDAIVSVCVCVDCLCARDIECVRGAAAESTGLALCHEARDPAIRVNMNHFMHLSDGETPRERQRQRAIANEMND